MKPVHVNETLDSEPETQNPQLPNTRPETLQRIMQVQQWMVSGLPSTDIVNAGMQQWNIGKSMMYNYLRQAYKEFKETADAERASRKQFHIEMRMKLFHDIMQQQQPGYQFAALQVLKDVAQLEGMYTMQINLAND